MYNKNIKVMDCTVRDGGLMNKWQFDDGFVREVYDACVEAGVDYMEIGYISSEKSFSRDEVGPWKFCSEKDLKRIVGDKNGSIKLSAMADIGRVDLDDIPLAADSSLDMIRVACYAHQVDKAITLAHHCIDKGYEATMLDATLLGMGRGAGNCPMELLIAFLKNPKYRMLPLLKTIQEQILPWNNKIDWGYHVPYLITGSLNAHPRSAIAYMESEKKDDFVSFMKEMHDYELLE